VAVPSHALARGRTGQEAGSAGRATSSPRCRC
jgi:hypothetical protein